MDSSITKTKESIVHRDAIRFVLYRMSKPINNYLFLHTIVVFVYKFNLFVQKKTMN